MLKSLAIYLSRLMLVANALNVKFHSTMKDILKQDFNVSYQKGPLKRIERCQAKGINHTCFVFYVCFFFDFCLFVVCKLCFFNI